MDLLPTVVIKRKNKSNAMAAQRLRGDEKTTLESNWTNQHHDIQSK